MGAFSIWHVLILGAAALLLFGGRGKISDMMGDLGKGIRSFKTGLTEADTPHDRIEPPAAASPQSPITLADAVPAQVQDRA